MLISSKTNKKVKMLIVNVFELTSNFLDESSVLGLFLKENVEKYMKEKAEKISLKELHKQIKNGKLKI